MKYDKKQIYNTLQRIEWECNEFLTCFNAPTHINIFLMNTAKEAEKAKISLFSCINDESIEKNENN